MTCPDELFNARNSDSQKEDYSDVIIPLDAHYGSL